jgi:hypothetical protein
MRPHHRQIDASEHGCIGQATVIFAADKVLEHRNEEEEHARWIDEVGWTVEIEATEINTRIMHQNHFGPTD